jgi:hypothetical protein
MALGRTCIQLEFLPLNKTLEGIHINFTIPGNISVKYLIIIQKLEVNSSPVASLSLVRELNAPQQKGMGGEEKSTKMKN